MTPERWNRLKPVFHGALEQPADRRRAWLREACADDASLARDAEALLDAYDTAGDFLEQPAPVDGDDVDTLPEGATLGAYRIRRELGRGGMGVVYLAKDNLGRDVAIKTLPPALAANPALRERLRREAAAAASIDHPSVATVHLLDEIDGHLIIVSEYVHGETLRTLLSRGAIEPQRAHAMAVEIAGALAAAHDVRVVHRDLKPENVIVTETGRVKIVDFGIAHMEAPENGRLTIPGMVLGTPAYMAPEQLAGGNVTARTDVYSFGIVFSEMLTGHHPRSKAVGPPIAPRFAAIIARCVKPDPGERFASGRELLAALTAESAATPTPASTNTAIGSPRWWWEFHQVFVAALYWLMMWPEWKGRQIVGGSLGRALFLATLVAVIVASLRLHLLFTSRFYPTELRWARRRAGLWIRLADWLFTVSLAATGILVGEDRSPVAIVLLAVAVGAAIGFLVIERATARAAFRNSTTPRELRHP
jgi:predicted Ser/Thr protein kinase